MNVGCRAGTGLLSMMAARAMMGYGEGSKGKVSACESYLPMGKLMWRVLQASGMDKMVNLFHKRSDELRVGEDLDARADVLVGSLFSADRPSFTFMGDKLKLDSFVLIATQHCNVSRMLESCGVLIFVAIDDAFFPQNKKEKKLLSLLLLYEERCKTS